MAHVRAVARVDPLEPSGRRRRRRALFRWRDRTPPLTARPAREVRGDGASAAEADAGSQAVVQPVPNASRAEAVQPRGGWSRPAVAFLAWSAVDGRSSEFAAALGGEARCYYSFRLVRPPFIPVRYALSALRMAGYLFRRRPRSVIVSIPPVFPGLIALAYARLAGVPIVLDSHPHSFGQKEQRHARVLVPIHAWMARRVTSVMVSSEELARRVEAWGGQADVVHEAPSTQSVAPAKPLGRRPLVLWIGIFAADEPVDEFVEAARRLPSVDALIPGDLRRCPRSVRASAPANVTFTGFLRGEAYRRLLEAADVIVVPTTDRTSVMRGAFEAVYACRPLIVSDLPHLRAVFPHAIYAANDAAGYAAAIRKALGHHAELVAAAPIALAEQAERWEHQRSLLVERLSQAPRMDRPHGTASADGPTEARPQR